MKPLASFVPRGRPRKYSDRKAITLNMSSATYEKIKRLTNNSKTSVSDFINLACEDRISLLSGLDAIKSQSRELTLEEYYAISDLVEQPGDLEKLLDIDK